MNIHLFTPIIIEAAMEAGKAILEVYHSNNFEVEFKGDHSPLTKADKKSNEVIMKYLAPTGLPVLSEEGRAIPYSERKEWNCFWLVDPLDGTKEFIKRNGEFTVNIALIENGVPVMGVVYVPCTEELYYGDLQTGAIKKVGNISEKLPIEFGRTKYTVVASRTHLSDETQQFIRELEVSHGELHFISKGSSLKLCMIAEGRADIYPRLSPTMEWDTAAGHAVILAAGGKINQLGKRESLLYNKENLLNPHFVAYA